MVMGLSSNDDISLRSVHTQVGDTTANEFGAKEWVSWLIEALQSVQWLAVLVVSLSIIS